MCVAVCCSVLQRVAVCSVLQCAVCCSVCRHECCMLLEVWSGCLSEEERASLQSSEQNLYQGARTISVYIYITQGKIYIREREQFLYEISTLLRAKSISESEKKFCIYLHCSGQNLYQRARTISVCITLLRAKSISKSENNFCMKYLHCSEQNLHQRARTISISNI